MSATTDRLRQAREDYQAAIERTDARYAVRLAEIDEAIPEVPGDSFGRDARVIARKEASTLREEQAERQAGFFREALRAAWAGHAERRQS